MKKMHYSIIRSYHGWNNKNKKTACLSGFQPLIPRQLGTDPKTLSHVQKTQYFLDSCSSDETSVDKLTIY